MVFLQIRPLNLFLPSTLCLVDVSIIHISGLFFGCLQTLMGFPGGSMVKNPPAHAGDMGLNPGSGRSPGEGNGNHSSILAMGNPVDRRAWWATVHGVAKE